MAKLAIHKNFGTQLYISCEKTGFEKLIGANYDQIRLLVETMSNFKSMPIRKTVCQFDVTLAPFYYDVMCKQERRIIQRMQNNVATVK